MDESSEAAGKPEETKELAEGIRTSRESLEKAGDKSKLLKEQLNRLEQKLWGRKPDETVST